ncbi:MAG: pectin esterase [Alkalibacterium sp.]|nr:pectin esterase [Alkalibacterium sp.]
MLVGKETFCDFHTIQSAVDSITENDEWLTIYIIEGIYDEQVVIKQSKVKLIGIGNVVITHAAFATQLDSSGNKIGTFETATLYLDGTDIHLENVTVENTAGHGEQVGQALALYANCDRGTFKQCCFKGYQDTLFTSCLPASQKDGSAFSSNRPVHQQYRQYYTDCAIEGTVDFIFGGATAYFDRCLIKSIKRIVNESSYITAACTPKEQAYGFIFNKCYLIGESGCKQVYLGRPWRPYAKVTFQECQMTDHIHSKRWNDWNEPDNRTTAEFIECQTNQPLISLENIEEWVTFDQQACKKVTEEDVFDTSFYKRVKEKGSWR